MKPIVATILAALTTSMASAQTDVTDKYITNPGFEDNASACVAGSASAVTEQADGLRGWNVNPTGWTVTKPDKALIISAECYTDNNAGKTTPHEGRLAYYQRNGWNDATSTMQQTTKTALAAGKYRLTCWVKAYAYNGAATSATLSVAAEQQTLGSVAVSVKGGATGSMADGEWVKRSIAFEVTSSAKATIMAKMTWGRGGSMIAWDDFKLEKLADTADIDAENDEDRYVSPTEGVITHEFVSEAEMMNDMLQMLATNMRYARNIWTDSPSATTAGERCGYFKANSAGQNNEDGVRTNADFSMLCAFVYKYAQGKATLPAGLTWADIKDMAMKALVYGYSTHKANRLARTTNNAYWGSTSAADAVWESSLWAMSLAYSAYFLSDELTAKQKDYIYKMLKAECNYELERTVPTGYAGDTKAEENGWEVDVLAATLGLYPNDELAKRWFERMRLFAINSYSHSNDRLNSTVIDPWYDQTAVKDLYSGQNLYSDYTLQNHNYFHTSYQNVVIQELGEARLALQMFQGAKTADEAKWHSAALMHNNDHVMNDVLKWLATADGELAMPNGNDWSMFLFDQITSYSTMACFARDADALMLENMAYKYIKARQQTTADGSWLLNSDIGPRRMGVEGHRVMMTYLMHLAASTANMQPATWSDFCQRHSEAKRFTTQDITRAASADRFAVFSWSQGLKSYTGYLASCRPDVNKIMCPYKANNTGNILGWYTVKGKKTDATPAQDAYYKLMGNAFTMNGVLKTNESTLQNSFALYTTPGNAVIYIDRVKALMACTITREQGGLTAVSTDPFTSTSRILYSAAADPASDRPSRVRTDGSATVTLPTNWANIDGQLGFVTTRTDGQMAFGDRQLSSSIYMSKLYPLYSDTERTFKTNDEVDRRHLVYYVNVDAATTAALAQRTVSLADALPKGWNGVIAPDPDGTVHYLISNLDGIAAATMQGVTFDGMAPVFDKVTTIAGNASTVKLSAARNRSLVGTISGLIAGIEGRAILLDDCMVVTNDGKKATANVALTIGGQTAEGKVTIGAGKTVCIKPNGTSLDTRAVDGYDWDGRGGIIDEVSAVATDTNATPTAVYDLNGRRISTTANLPRGIYVANNRKVAVQ